MASKLFEGTATDTELHVEFSALAQDVEITVGGGTLISAEIYGRAADLKLSSGVKHVTITGTRLNESSIVTTYPASNSGEVDVEQNPLITSDAMANALANHVRSYLQMRNTYDTSYRGNPELEPGDVIGLQTRYTDEIDALILTDEIRFNGALRGTLKLKGLIGGKLRTDEETGREIIRELPEQLNFLEYNGEVQEPAWSGYDETVMVIGGITEAVNAGEYAAEFTPLEGYEWFDGTTETKSVMWTITALFIEMPTISGDLTYNGETQSPKLNGYDENTMVLGGTTSAVNAGTYTLTVTPKANYQWKD